ncbi:MAG: type I-E CRISPR-associated protein Cas7/Cse4/CasC [Dehalococcoidia bacterium]|nr:type I-E CRISPR-associated protein Cas7/Cse4/CasC [Dehalococcoidia bacterium]
MTTPRFLQIHTLHSYPAALLNRDDSGLAKRMPFGGVVRTRISSQCLKRHWRVAQDEFALKNIDGFTDSMRTRNAVSLGVMQPLKEVHAASVDVLQGIEAALQENIYSESGTQPLLLGLPEVEYLQAKASSICAEHPNDPRAARDAVNLLFSTRRANEERDNFRAFREASRFPGGLISALFGRMVTSDPAANMDAAVHVAHAFTVHGEEREMDFWAAVEDLPKEEEGPGAAHLNDMELTAGLFYGYVVVSNLEGCDAGEWENADRDLAGKVVEHLTHLIATVSPGAKLGSTAPYGFADLMLIEAGSRQPRSLANAYREPARARIEAATEKLAGHLGKLDAAYGGKEVRRVMSVEDCDIPSAERLCLDDLATWAADAARSGAAV